MTTPFTISCYDRRRTYKESRRAKMTREYQTAMLCCDGREAERYSNIYQDLIAGEKECIDTERPLIPELEAMLEQMFATA